MIRMVGARARMVKIHCSWDDGRQEDIYCEEVRFCSWGEERGRSMMGPLSRGGEISFAGWSCSGRTRHPMCCSWSQEDQMSWRWHG